MNHPFIIKHIENFIEGDKFFIVMDYADGGTLYQRIEKHQESKKLISED